MTTADRQAAQDGPAADVAFQDLYSNKMLAWRVDLDPNKVAVMSAFGELIETWGIPKHCLFDNGHEFANRWLTGGTPIRFRFKVRDDDGHHQPRHRAALRGPELQGAGVLSVDEPEGVTAKIESAVSLAGIGATFKASELRRKLGFSDPEDVTRWWAVRLRRRPISAIPRTALP